MTSTLSIHYTGFIKAYHHIALEEICLWFQILLFSITTVCSYDYYTYVEGILLAKIYLVVILFTGNNIHLSNISTTPHFNIVNQTSSFKTNLFGNSVEAAELATKPLMLSVPMF